MNFRPARSPAVLTRSITKMIPISVDMNKKAPVKFSLIITQKQNSLLITTDKFFCVT